jgi:hypothetical protein
MTGILPDYHTMGLLSGLAIIPIYAMLHQRTIARRVIDTAVVAGSMGVLLTPILEMVAYHGVTCAVYQWINSSLVATSSTLDNPVFAEYGDTFKCHTG